MKNLNIPNTWENISVKTFIELQEELHTENNNLFLKLINIISILCDIDIYDSVWNNIYLSDMNQLNNDIKFLNEKPSSSLINEIDEFKLIKFNDLSLGEYIDLDRYLEKGFDNLPLICSVLYRKYSTDEFGNVLLEKYENINIEERSKFFEQISINKVYGIIEELIKFKNNVNTTYYSEFVNEEPDEEFDDEYFEKDVIAEQKEKLQKQFAWELLIYSIAKGDFTKYDDILKLNFLFLMNQLSIKRAFNLD